MIQPVVRVCVSSSFSYMRIHTASLALFAVVVLPAKASLESRFKKKFTPARSNDRAKVSFTVVGSDMKTVIENSACKYTMGMKISEPSLDEFLFIQAILPNKVLWGGVKCLNLARISSLDGCANCADAVTPTDGSNKITCKKGRHDELTYEFLDTSKGVGAFANLASSVRLAFASFRKVTLAKLVQIQADKLCGFLSGVVWDRVTFEIGDVLRLANTKAFEFKVAIQSWKDLRAGAETELEEMKARVIGVWRKELSHMFVEPFKDLVRRADSHSPVRVTYSVGRLVMESADCGIVLPLFWLVPEQRETLERSIISTCLETSVVPVATPQGGGGSTRGIIRTADAPPEVSSLEVGGDLALVCSFENEKHEYRFKKGGRGDPLHATDPSKDRYNVLIQQEGYGWLTAMAVCQQLRTVSGHVQAIAGYKSGDELDEEGKERFMPRLAEEFEVAGLVYWIVSVGDLIASSDYSAVFTVLYRSDIVIKYEGSCGGHLHPLLNEYQLGRIAATVRVSPMPLFLSPLAPMSTVCDQTSGNSVCAAPGTNPKAKLQFNIFAAKTDMALSTQCRESGIARYMISERTGSCLDRKLVAGPTGLVEAIRLGVETIKLLRKLHDVGVVHGNIHASTVCNWLASRSGLALVGFESGRLVSDESDSRSYERPLKTDVEATPWQLKGFPPARRDDIYNALFMVAKLIHGQSAFDRMTAGKRLNPKDLLLWKQRGPLFRSESFDPIQTWLETKGLSAEKGPGIHAALNAVHAAVAGIRHVGTVIPYSTIIEQLENIMHQAASPVGLISSASSIEVAPRVVRPVDVSGELHATDFDYIVVIPDVHGDDEGLVTALWIALRKVGGPSLDRFPSRDHLSSAFTKRELVDPPTGQRVALIQLGDLVDHGPYSEECINIMLNVKRVLGWTVRTLIGSHELLRMNGDSRYMHAHDLFVSGMRPANHDIGGREDGTTYKIVSREFLAMVRVSGPPGANTLLVHAGVSNSWLQSTNFNFNGTTGESLVAEVNAYYRNYLLSFIGVKSLATSAYNPMWNALLALPGRLEPIVDCERGVEILLKRFEVDRIIVGHTPQFDHEFKERCGGKVIIADIALSDWMQETGSGRPAALVMDLRGKARKDDYQFIPHTIDGPASLKPIL